MSTSLTPLLGSDEEHVPPEQRLWRKVLIRAWDEANGRHVYTGDVEIQVYHARKWLTRRSRGLQDVLEKAGYDELAMEKLITHCREVFGDVGKKKVEKEGSSDE